MCLRLLSRLNYILGDYAEAMSTQHKAVMMCERLYGVDHSQTITEYVSLNFIISHFISVLKIILFFYFKTHLALYAFANNQINNSIKLLYRARYLLMFNFGEDHPEMSLIDVIIQKKIDL